MKHKSILKNPNCEQPNHCTWCRYYKYCDEWELDHSTEGAPTYIIKWGLRTNE